MRIIQIMHIMLIDSASFAIYAYGLCILCRIGLLCLLSLLIMRVLLLEYA